MVQVVGRDPVAVKRKTCRSCASILEFTGSEIIERNISDYGGGSDTYYWIVCPTCGKDVDLSYKDKYR